MAHRSQERILGQICIHQLRRAFHYPFCQVGTLFFDLGVGLLQLGIDCGYLGFCPLALGNIKKYRDIIVDLAIFCDNGGNGEPLRVNFAIFAFIPYFALPELIVEQALPHAAVEFIIVAAGFEHTGSIADGLFC